MGASVTDAGFTIAPPNAAFSANEHEHPADYYFTRETGGELSSYQFVYMTCGEGASDSAAGNNLVVPARDLLILCLNVWHGNKPAPKHLAWTDLTASLFADSLGKRSLASRADRTHRCTGQTSGSLSGITRTYEARVAQMPDSDNGEIHHENNQAIPNQCFTGCRLFSAFLRLRVDASQFIGRA